MISMESIREQINAVLRASMSLDDFEDWLVSSSWNVMRDADPALRQFVGAIELRLAEYSSGHLDEADLLNELHALLVYGCPAQPIQTVFISIGNPSELMTLTVADRPDYQFNFRTLHTSPATRTGSAKTVLFSPAAGRLKWAEAADRGKISS